MEKINKIREEHILKMIIRLEATKRKSNTSLWFCSPNDYYNMGITQAINELKDLYKYSQGGKNE